MATLRSLSDMARELGVSANGIRRAIVRGAVRGERIGSYWAVDATSARRYFKTARTNRKVRVR